MSTSPRAGAAAAARRATARRRAGRARLRRYGLHVVARGAPSRVGGAARTLQTATAWVARVAASDTTGWGLGRGRCRLGVPAPAAWHPQPLRSAALRNPAWRLLLRRAGCPQRQPSPRPPPLSARANNGHLARITPSRHVQERALRVLLALAAKPLQPPPRLHVRRRTEHIRLQPRTHLGLPPRTPTAAAPCTYACRLAYLRLQVLRFTDAASADALGAARRELPKDADGRSGGRSSRLTVSSSPHYLMFEAEGVVRGDTRLKCSPPLRGSRNRQQLWRALADGTIDFLASDHTPTTLEMRAGDAARSNAATDRHSLPRAAVPQFGAWRLHLLRGRWRLWAALVTLTRDEPGLTVRLDIHSSLRAVERAASTAADYRRLLTVQAPSWRLSRASAGCSSRCPPRGRRRRSTARRSPT